MALINAHHPAMNEDANQIDERTAALLEQVATLRKLSPKQKRQLKQIIMKQPPKPKPKPSKCRPRDSPLDTWKPKDPAKAKTILALFLDDAVGIVTANVAEMTLSNKVMTNELAAAASGQMDSAKVKSALATNSVLCASLLARTFELAKKIQAEEDGHEEALFEMHTHRQTAGFHKSRGSGIAANTSGLALLKRAATELRVRLG